MDAELLNVWERGRRCSPPRRALLLLAAACPELTPEQLARLPIGRRDALLLTLRDWTFGTHVEAVLDCPACGCRLEAACRSDDLRVPGPSDAAAVHEVEFDGRRVAFRLPDSFDLLHAASTGSLAAARRVLGARCLACAADTAPVELSEALLAALARAVATADPEAAMTLDADCPGCGAIVSAPWDVLSFFWRELHAWALRVLREVHTLASAYGWTESIILALSAQRRRLYLDMVTA